MGKFRLVSRWEDFFFLFSFFCGGGGWGGGGCAVSSDFWAIRPRVCGNGAFPGDLLAGELSEKNFLYFEQWLSRFICLFIYLLLSLLFLVGVN